MLIVKNWGYLASLGHFEIVAAENGEKPKSDIYWQFCHIYLKTFVSEGGKYQELVENILLCNGSFLTIQDGSQLWPIECINITSM